MAKVAVLIPCYNEALTVEKVVKDFKRELPLASIYVYDNNSTDNTYELAQNAGAIVRKEPLQGKGNVVKSMFRDIDADCYILVDGDDTYPAEAANDLVHAVVNEGIDMCVGDRLSNGTYASENKRGFHNFGNNLVKGLINKLFKNDFNDIMTGYRAFSKKYVKCMPIMSEGFQIETEMSIFSLVYGMRIKQIPIVYRDRPAGSESKLNTVKDGIKVLVTLFDLFKNYRPFLFFTLISLLFVIFGFIVGVPVLIEFSQTHFITKVPSAILASSLVLISIFMFTTGIILDAIKNQTRFLFECKVNEFYVIDKKR